jgi:hypothetical protein
MEDSIYGYVMTQLEAAKGHWPAIAESAGVPHRTLEKIARMEIKDPGISHIEKLYRFFKDQEVAAAATD